MQKLKNENGITLIVLVIIVIVLSLISIPVVINTTNVTQFNKYSRFKEDMDNLREAVSVAFFDKDIKDIGPKYTGSVEFLNGTQNDQDIKNPNDNTNYYVINVNKVNLNLTVNMTDLNNGSGNYGLSGDETTYTGTDDVYIINEQSRTIYYVKGVQYNGYTYYRLSEKLSEIPNT